jgi:hypothetical protein
MRHPLSLVGVAALAVVCSGAARAANCDKSCLEGIGDQYRAAYVKHDPTLAPFSKSVKFSENNVMMEFPDGSWDTITQETGPALTLSDPSTGNVGIYTTIMQKDTPGFLAVRLRVEHGKITEIEHILSTKRNLSGPPTPIGDVKEFTHDPDLVKTVPPEQRASRAELVSLANGYFSTLEHNNGEIRGTRFSPDASRSENGKQFKEIEKGFKSGFYAFNNRVRDRDFFLVDEERGIAMARGFIDHKGVMDGYRLTDGTEQHSIFREPQTWSFLEMFKIKNHMITGVEATFIGAPYYIRSPWTKHPDPR